MARQTICPFAVQRILRPEATGAPVIEPRLLVFHTHGFDGSSRAVGNYFDRGDVGIESTFSIPAEGPPLQFMPADRWCDAQHDANPFAGSVETEDGGDPSRPWTSSQVYWGARLARWYHDEWGVPLHKAGRWNGSGIGYHRQFWEWNKSRHACPGAVREAQLYDEVLPLAIQGDDDVDPDIKRKIDDLWEEFCLPDPDGVLKRGWWLLRNTNHHVTVAKGRTIAARVKRLLGR